VKHSIIAAVILAAVTFGPTPEYGDRFKNKETGERFRYNGEFWESATSNAIAGYEREQSKTNRINTWSKGIIMMTNVIVIDPDPGAYNGQVIRLIPEKYWLEIIKLYPTNHWTNQVLLLLEAK